MLIAVLVGAWAIYLVVSDQLRGFLKDRLTQALLLFFFIGALSSISAIFLTHTVTAHIGILHLLRRVEYLMLLPVIATVVKTKKQLITTLIILIFVVLAVNFYALGQQYLDWPVISTTNSEFSKGLLLRLTPGARVNSTFAGHYDLAVFLAMVITILTAMFFAVRKRLKFLIIGLGSLSLIVLIMTAARLSFAAAFFGIITALILLKKKKYIFLIFIASAIILIYPSQLRDRFVSTITINLLNMGQRYEGKTQDQQIRSRLNIPTLAIKTSSESAETSTFATGSGEVATDITPGEPIDTTELGVYRSFQIRLNIEWPRAIRAFWKNPFLGTGYSSIDIATDNDILRSLGEVGFLGTAALGLVFIEVGKRIFCCIRGESKFVRYFSAGVLAMMVAFLVNGLFIDVLESSKVATLFWMMLGLNLAVLKFKKTEWKF
ncbi:MAG: O-antigen ligase family protein [Nanoarchaeota archaeon]